MKIFYFIARNTYQNNSNIKRIFVVDFQRQVAAGDGRAQQLEEDKGKLVGNWHSSFQPVCHSRHLIVHNIFQFDNISHNLFDHLDFPISAISLKFVVFLELF